MSNTGTKQIEEQVEERVNEQFAEANEIVESYPEREANYRRYVKYVALFSAGLLWGSLEQVGEVIEFVVTTSESTYVFNVPYAGAFVGAIAVLVIAFFAWNRYFDYKNAKAFLEGDSR